jgi:hypothetical protein
VLEGHPGAVIAAADALDPLGMRGLKPDSMRTGIARILQEFPYEDPGIIPVSFGLEASALKKCVGSVRSHGDSLSCLEPAGENGGRGEREYVKRDISPATLLPCSAEGRKDTMDVMTNEQTIRLRTFIRSTLGCGCPDDVLEWIQCTHTEFMQEEDSRITRIDVGGRLLVYVLEIDGPDRRAEEALPAVVAAATVDRATSCFNRLRVVVAIDDPEEMKPRIERCFSGCAPADDKVHLHVVRTTDLPFE